jgi:hypothetical protein
MNRKHIVHKVDDGIWVKAQEFELKTARHRIEVDDDWNNRWYEKFDEYSYLQGNHLVFWGGKK